MNDIIIISINWNIIRLHRILEYPDASLFYNKLTHLESFVESCCGCEGSLSSRLDIVSRRWFLRWFHGNWTRCPCSSSPLPAESWPRLGDKFTKVVVRNAHISHSGPHNYTILSLFPQWIYKWFWFWMDGIRTTRDKERSHVLETRVEGQRIYRWNDADVKNWLAGTDCNRV